MGKYLFLFLLFLCFNFTQGGCLFWFFLGCGGAVWGVFFFFSFQNSFQNFLISKLTWVIPKTKMNSQKAVVTNSTKQTKIVEVK